MRLGEIKNLVGEVLDSENKIFIEQEPIYGGQAHKVNNYRNIIAALDVLAEEVWNDQDYSEVEAIKKKYGRESMIRTLETQDFNHLNSYINSPNHKVPLYYAILDSLVIEQDEKTLNIKLPEIHSLGDLSALNKRLEEIFKLFNIDGEFEFQGFDKGSDWYVIATHGALSYYFAVACLSVMQEYFKARTEYFKSEEAKIAFETAKKNSETLTQEEYQEQYLTTLVENKVRHVINEVGETAGHSAPELQLKLVKATTKLIQELDQGTEFHLSLNPPKYAQEEGGMLVIDYKSVKSLKPVEKKVKELTAGSKDTAKKQ